MLANRATLVNTKAALSELRAAFFYICQIALRDLFEISASKLPFSRYRLSLEQIYFLKLFCRYKSLTL